MRTIFVSSTFRDMQQERDAIRDIVAPQMNQEARKHGDFIDFCDLRWGINTENMDESSASHKVLDVCLGEIDKSQPPMIILLGERYGWIPEQNFVREIASREDWELNYLEQSVTALEIEYGAFYRRRPVLIYIREIEGSAPSEYLAEDDEHRYRLNQLKKRLIALAPDSVRRYTVHLEKKADVLEDVNIPETEIKSFADRVVADLKEMFLPDWKRYDQKTPFERSLETQWAFVHEKDQQFFARQSDCTLLLKKVYGGERVVAAVGISGSGKSTLFSRIACHVEKSGWDVLPFVSGLTPDSNLALNILRYSVRYLQHLLHRDLNDSGDDKALQERFRMLSAEYAKTGRKMLIMVDAVDQLFDDDYRQNAVYIPDGTTGSIQFFLTALSDTELPTQSIHRLQPLDTKDRRLVIDSILRWKRKEISNSVIDFVCDMTRLQTPLAISLMIERLRMMNSVDFQTINHASLAPIQAITEHQMQLVRNCPTELEQLSTYIFELVAQRINHNLLNRVMKALAVSRYGLRSEDLAGLCGSDWSRLDFVHFINYLNESFLVRPDGRYDFMHKCFREGLCKTFDIRSMHYEVSDYLSKLDIEDPVRSRELVYHLVCADRKKEFLQYIALLYSSTYKKAAYLRDDGANTLYYCVLCDDGKWLLELLKSVDNSQDALYLTWFLAFELYNKFGNLRQEMKLIEPLYVLSLELVKKNENKLGSNNTKRLLSKHYDILQSNCINMDKNEAAIQYGEEYLCLIKGKMNDSPTLQQKDALFRVYYLLLCAYKSLDSEELLTKALKHANEAAALLTEEYIEYRCKHGKMLGEFYGCLGDVYRNLNLYQLAVEVYRKDVQYRQARYEYLKDNVSLGLLCGAYYNVAMGLQNLPSEDNLKEAWELSCKASKLLEPVIESGIADDFTKSALGRSYTQTVTLMNTYPKLFTNYNGQTALQLILKAESLFIDISHRDETHYMQNAHAGNILCLTKIKGLQFSETNQKAVSGFVKLISDLEEFAEESEKHSTLMYDVTCYSFATMLSNSVYPQWKEMSKVYFEKAKDLEVRQVTDSRVSDSNFAEDSEKNVMSIFRNYSGSKRIRLKRHCTQKQLDNACKIYAKEIDPKKIIALVDFTFMKNGKQGMLFTNDRLCASFLPAPIFYSNICSITLRGDDCILVCKDGMRHQLDIPGDSTDIYGVLKEIVQLQKRD